MISMPPESLQAQYYKNAAPEWQGKSAKMRGRLTNHTIF